MSIPKAMYRFNAIPIKIPMAYFTDQEQIFQKWTKKSNMEPKKTLNSLSNLEEEQQNRRGHNTWYQTILQGHCNQNILEILYWFVSRSLSFYCSLQLDVKVIHYFLI